MSTAGLVLCLDALNPKSYPGSGSMWFDISGNNTHFNLVNSPTYDSSGYFTFNGTNQQISSITTFPLQLINTDFTVRIIFYTTSTNSNDGLLLWGSGPYNGGTGVEIRKRGTAYLEFSVNDGVGGTPGIRTYAGGNQTNVWTDFCITYKTTTESKWYVNGVYGVTTGYATETTQTNTNTMVIGRGTDSYWPGRIAFISFYNRVLSDIEVKQNFMSIRNRYSL